MRSQLDHEKLQVYQASLGFIAWTLPLLDKVPKNMAVHNQLDRASTSVPLNIAEVNGKYTSSDRCRFFDIARGSALECGACLDVMVAKQLTELSDIAEGKRILVSIVSMLYGMIKANSDERIYENPPDYRIGTGDSREQEQE